MKEKTPSSSPTLQQFIMRQERAFAAATGDVMFARECLGRLEGITPGGRSLEADRLREVLAGGSR